MQKGNASLRKFVLGASRAGAQCRESGLDRRGGAGDRTDEIAGKRRMENRQQQENRIDAGQVA